MIENTRVKGFHKRTHPDDPKPGGRGWCSALRLIRRNTNQDPGERPPQPSGELMWGAALAPAGPREQPERTCCGGNGHGPTPVGSVRGVPSNGTAQPSDPHLTPRHEQDSSEALFHQRT